MVIRIGNLILASGAVLVSLIAWLGWHWAGSYGHRSPTASEPLLPLLLVLILATCWLAGAVGLFFHKRMAWLVSLLGAGASVCSCGALIFGLIWVFLHPNADTGPSQDFPVAVVLIALLQFSIPLAASLALVRGLLRMRR
jgi:hypothetical protein